MIRRCFKILEELAWLTAWLFFWPLGRLSQRAYIITSLLLATCIMLTWATAPIPEPTIPGLQTGNLLSNERIFAIFFAPLLPMTMLCSKRLHDGGFSALNVTDTIGLLFLPILPVAWLFALFLPQEQIGNEYGEPFSMLQSLKDTWRTN